MTLKTDLCVYLSAHSFKTNLSSGTHDLDPTEKINKIQQ